MRRELAALVAGPQIATRAEIAAQLARLALHYWRPNFSPEQYKMLFDDYCTDLHGVALQELTDAIAQYRKEIGERFFPTIAQITKLIGSAVKDRNRLKLGAQRMLDALDAPDNATGSDAAKPRDFSEIKQFLKPRGPEVPQTVAAFVPVSPELRARVQGGER